MSKIKKTLSFLLKATFTLLITISIYLFFSQEGLRGNHDSKSYSKVLNYFVENITHKGFIGWIKNLGNADASKVSVHREEQVIRYKLKMLSKSLNSYFLNLSQGTEFFVNENALARFILKKSYTHEKQALSALLKKYLKDNKELLEISLFNKIGEKVSSIKYKHVADYSLDAGLLKSVENQRSTLIRNKINGNLVVLSKIEAQDGNLIGYIAQTISATFFTKLLDHLEINQNLFYLKNSHNEIIVDNYKTYELIKKDQYNMSKFFYKKLTKLYTNNININVQDTRYSLGVIIEKKNAFGNLVAILSLLAMLYCSMMIVKIFSKHFLNLIGQSKQETFYKKKRKQSAMTFFVSSKT